MNELIKKYLKGDHIIWMVFALLCLVSAIEMYSASSSLAYKSYSYTAPMLRHVMFLGIGAAIVMIIHNVPYKYFRLFPYIMLPIALVLLLYTILWGVSSGDAKRWIEIMGVQFQPSELAKISVIIFIADILARKQQEEKSADEAFKPIIIVLGVFCLLIFPENFSTAALLFLIGLLMMIIGRISIKTIMKLLVPLMIVGGILFFIGWKVPKNNLPPVLDRLPTQVNRVLSFLNEDEENKYVITDKNRQVVNSQIAIANGGFFPKLPGSSIQRDYLPEAYSDFIFAIIIEEMGILGGIFVIALYLILLFRAGMITYKSDMTFPALLVIGLTMMIVIQAFASMAVAVHLGPVTGQPLPLISRGGTSILVTCIYFGMILSVTRYIQEEKKENETVTEETTENKEN